MFDSCIWPQSSFSQFTGTTDRLCHFPGALDDIDVLATDWGLGIEATHAVDQMNPHFRTENLVAV